MTISLLPDEVPADLQDLASRLSWEDAVNLLCLFEGSAVESRNNQTISAKFQVLAERMRSLAHALPYNWEPTEVVEHDIITWLANDIRRGGGAKISTT